MDAKKVKVPVREQEPAVRATNFDEVCLGYSIVKWFTCIFIP